MNKEQEELRKKSPVQIKNKKASFEYFFIETYTAGIVLTGTEIKSIRLGKASLVDTYCTVINGELWVKQMSVSPYFYGSYNNHVQKRDRKLLLTKREIRELESATRQTGYTIVPLLVFIDDKGVPRWISPSVRVRRSMTSVRRSRRRKTGEKWTGR